MVLQNQLKSQTIKPCVPQEVPAPAQQPSRLARIAGSTITATVPAALFALALKDTQLASDAMRYIFNSCG